MKNPLASAAAGQPVACLVVEDDSLIRLDLEETLRDFGIPCVFGAATAEGAVQIIETADIRFAVLDYELARGNTEELAALLVARGIPAVFLTAYGEGLALPASLRHLKVISKPYSPLLLAEALRAALATLCELSRKNICCAEPPG